MSKIIICGRNGCDIDAVVEVSDIVLPEHDYYKMNVYHRQSGYEIRTIGRLSNFSACDDNAVRSIAAVIAETGSGLLFNGKFFHCEIDCEDVIGAAVALAREVYEVEEEYSRRYDEETEGSFQAALKQLDAASI